MMTDIGLNEPINASRAKSSAQELALNELYAALQALSNVDELASFLTDLCTPAELHSLADRWRVAKLLHEGHAYRLINEKTGVSTATITRVARSLSYGAGGYQIILNRTKEGSI